jgi:hypothetical protein
MKNLNYRKPKRIVDLGRSYQIPSILSRKKGASGGEFSYRLEMS